MSDLECVNWSTVDSFTNILRMALLYEICACSFWVLTFKVCTFFGSSILAQKLLLKCWWHWHLDKESEAGHPFDDEIAPEVVLERGRIPTMERLSSLKYFKTFEILFLRQIQIRSRWLSLHVHHGIVIRVKLTSLDLSPIDVIYRLMWSYLNGSFSKNI